jgi:multimeric flavodoxin WrbA
MSKVILLNASPRTNSNTKIVLEECAREIEAEGVDAALTAAEESIKNDNMTNDESDPEPSEKTLEVEKSEPKSKKEDDDNSSNDKIFPEAIETKKENYDIVDDFDDDED